MYHVAGTGITIFILYILSYLLYRIGYYTLSFHKKLWNSVLAIVFLSTALAGVFIALQMTYKWDIPDIKNILKWHVEFGTGMAFTGIIHFSWHLSYFSKLFTKENKQVPENKNILFNNVDPEKLGINLFVVGFVSSSVQFLLIREMMNISGGYELIAGVFLGTWLIASAAGSALAGKSFQTDIGKINIIFSISPVFSLFLMFLITMVFLETGETPSFLISLIFTLIALFPFCLVSGFTFVRLIRINRQSTGTIPGKSFARETSGGITAGIVLSALLAGDIGNYKLLLVIISLSVAYSLLTYYIIPNKIRIIVKVLFAIAITFMMIYESDNLFRQILLPAIKVVESKDTPYGNITRGDNKGENCVFYNHRLLRYNNDVIEREEDIHYAMLQYELPHSVILISGNPDSDIPEILKYPVEKIVYIERDPALAKSSLASGLKKCVMVSNSDAYSYIRKSTDKTDIIIMLVPPPSTLLLNRYYTTEFFLMIKKRLNKGGIFMCSPGIGDTYFNDESIRLNSSVFNSLKEVFPNVLPVAGNKLYYIASESQLSASFCYLTERRGIKNSYVSSDYLSDDLTIRKSEEILNLLDPEVKSNCSSFPVSYNYFQSYHFSKNRNEKAPLLILLSILFAIPLLAIRRKNMVMYFSASALAGLEIIALLTLQLTVGNMYQLTGLIIAGLMTGLAIGSGLEIPGLSQITVTIKSLILIIIYTGIALIYNSILNIENSFLAICTIMLLTFIPALVTGNIFRELTLENDNQNNVSSVYSADLSGSAFGFIAVSGFVVPNFGTTGTIYFLGLLVFAGFLLGTIANKH
jgi:spermidine synthase